MGQDRKKAEEKARDEKRKEEKAKYAQGIANKSVQELKDELRQLKGDREKLHDKLKVATDKALDGAPDKLSAEVKEMDDKYKAVHEQLTRALSKEHAVVDKLHEKQIASK